MYRHLNWIVLGIVLLLWAGCTQMVIWQPTPAPAEPAAVAKASQPTEPETIPSHKTGTPKEDRTPDEEKPKSNPQALASLELINQARTLIEKNRPDAAIRVLERSVNLHPQNGRVYYYLAEAWLKKGNVPQAKEFHRLADIYLRNDRQWSLRLKIQEQKITNF